MNGYTITDVPLDEIIDSHRLQKATITSLLKEFDMSKTGKGPKLADVETSDIFGVSNWTSNCDRVGGTNASPFS